MCLPLYMPSGRDDCCGGLCMPQFANPTEKARKLQDAGKILMAVHFLFTAFKFAIWGFGNAMSDVFSILILWCGIKRIDYCCVLLYLISVVQSLFTLAVGLCFFAQKDLREKTQPGLNVFSVNQAVNPNLKFQLTFSCFLVIFYCAAIYVSLLVYREFKGMMED